jgi:hypothetical protein
MFNREHHYDQRERKGVFATIAQKLGVNYRSGPWDNKEAARSGHSHSIVWYFFQSYNELTVRSTAK